MALPQVAGSGIDAAEDERVRVHYQVVARPATAGAVWDYYPYWAPSRDRDDTERLAYFAAQTGYEAVILECVTAERLESVARAVVERQETSFLPALRYLPATGMLLEKGRAEHEVVTTWQPEPTLDPYAEGADKGEADARRLESSFREALARYHLVADRIDLMRFIVEVLALLKAKPGDGSLLPDWLARACTAMGNEGNLKGGVRRLGELAGVSAGHLCRTIRAHYGMTPTSFVADLRLRHPGDEADRDQHHRGLVVVQRRLPRIGTQGDSLHEADRPHHQYRPR